MCISIFETWRAQGAMKLAASLAKSMNINPDDTRQIRDVMNEIKTRTKSSTNIMDDAMLFSIKNMAGTMFMVTLMSMAASR